MMRFRFPLLFLTFLFILFLLWMTNAATFTPALAQQPTDTPSGDISSTGIFITVISEEPQINVRMGPSSSVYPKVGFLLKGATVPALGKSPGGDWIQIEYPGAPDNKGWVYSPLVQVSDGTLRVIEPPPTPVPPATSTIDPTLAAQFFTAVPTSTRPPTFTPAPAITRSVFTESPIINYQNSIPRITIISALALLGLVGFILSLLVKR